MNRQRVLAAMIDALDLRFYEAGDMPRLKALGNRGGEYHVQAVVPTVTNANNVSIACADFPAAHGITGNSYFDARSGQAEYMESAADLCAPTILQRVARAGGKAALLTCKVKTTSLLGEEADLVIAAERPAPEHVERWGPAPDIYSAEINYWIWRAAIDLLATRPDLDLLYVHTTDFPQHAWRPGDPRHHEHLQTLDELIAEALDVDPALALYATGDHGMNDKRVCWDLATACANRGTPVRFALSAERDRYLRHHRTFGGLAWIWLKRAADSDAVAQTILALDGVESVLTRSDAARRFDLMPERIGELVVLGDIDTVFGELPGDGEREKLPDDYRSHGSTHERAVPIVEFNPPAARTASPTANVQLLAPLVDGWIPSLGGR